MIIFHISFHIFHLLKEIIQENSELCQNLYYIPKNRARENS